ncbi:type II toxin-antitoxin system RelE/ParE family toxin [Duganella vulcania]|uniref:type II toxin-antitoxin system RelE/ParE family toxin n=1 Tax=Duganella vulcania TaxID=2692166 RepID=UPI0035A60672
MGSSGSAGSASLIVRWSRAAEKSFGDTLRRIHQQDPGTSQLILQRVHRALAVLVIQPGVGTPIPGTHIRRFVIPRTGHYIDYRVVDGELLISKWMRQTRKRKN